MSNEHYRTPHTDRQPRLSRAETKARTRADLLTAAARMFARKGYAGASLEEIAQTAGYTIGAVYSNFTNKEQLFNEVLSDWVTARLNQLSTIIAGDRTPAGGEPAPGGPAGRDSPDPGPIRDAASAHDAAPTNVTTPVHVTTSTHDTALATDAAPATDATRDAKPRLREDRLREVGEMLIQIADAEHDVVTLQAEFWLYAIRNPEQMRNLAERTSVSLKATESYLRAALEPDGHPASDDAEAVDWTGLATVTFALFEGLVRQRRIDADRVPPELFSSALTWLVDGARAS